MLIAFKNGAVGEKKLKIVHVKSSKKVSVTYI